MYVCTHRHIQMYIRVQVDVYTCFPNAGAPRLPNAYPRSGWRRLVGSASMLCMKHQGKNTLWEGLLGEAFHETLLPVCVSAPLCLSLALSLSLSLSLGLSICVSLLLCLSVAVCLSVSVCPFICLCLCLSLSLSLSTYPSMHLSLYPYISIYLPTHISMCLYLSIYLSYICAHE